MIVLLGLLGVIIIPKIGDSINNSKNNAYLVQVESIKKGVNDFLVDNSSMLDSTGTYTMKLGTIKQGGYLPINIKNPKTKKNFSNESEIIINVNENSYDISLNLIDLVDVNESIDSNSPILVLNGNYIEFVEVNSEYQELNAIAKSSDGKNINDISIQIKKDDEEIDSIDTTTLGTYSVVYSATDESGYTTTQTRTVIVRDSTPPDLNIPEDTTIFIARLSGYDLLNGVEVSDNYDNDVTIKTNSNLANVVGNYVVDYTATDSSGNETVKRRIISVVDPTYNVAYRIKGTTIKSSNANPTMDKPIKYTGLGSTGYIDIVSTGKNLFDKSKYLQKSDYIKCVSNGDYDCAKIFLKPNTTYKISVKHYNNYDGKTGYLLLNDNPSINHNYSPISHREYPNYSLTNYIHTTDKNGLLYLGSVFYNNQNDLDTIWSNTDVQIEEGTTPTEFEEYKGGTTRIDMTGHDPLMCVEDTCDYIDFNTKKIVRYVKKIVFDENNKLHYDYWPSNNTDYTRGIYYWHKDILGEYLYPKFRDNKGFSTHFSLGMSGSSMNDAIRFSVTPAPNPPYISFRIPLDLSYSKWNNWLTEQNNKDTPLTVYIVLKEPEYEDIELPNIDLYGSYHLFATDGNISSNIEIIN